jgi:hypothetical protein
MDTQTKILLYKPKGLCVEDILYINTNTQTKIQIKYFHTIQRTIDPHSVIVITKHSIILNEPINSFS